MKKKGHRPVTRVKNPEPHAESPDWVIWAAWADRITFEEIEKKNWVQGVRCYQDNEKIIKTILF